MAMTMKTAVKKEARSIQDLTGWSYPVTRQLVDALSYKIVFVEVDKMRKATLHLPAADQVKARTTLLATLGERARNAERKGKTAAQRAAPVVVVRCASCRGRREIGPGEIAPGDFPTCPKCYVPMLPEQARSS